MTDTIEIAFGVVSKKRSVFLKAALGVWDQYDLNMGLWTSIIKQMIVCRGWASIRPRSRGSNV